MTIWWQDSLSALGSCKGVRDYKQHFQGWRSTQQVGYVKDDANTTYKFARRMLHYEGRYRANQ